MGLFGNYNKPGPGVDKNAPKKRGVFLYFELFGRKLGKILQVNMLYFLVSLPVLFLYYAYLFMISARLLSGIAAENSAAIQQLSSFLILTLACLWGTGPVSCGFSYILRNFAREEHVWLTSDFFGKIKNNFKQGMLVLLIDFIVLLLGSNALYFYFQMYVQKHSMIALYGFFTLLVILLIFTFMHFYIHQFIVTFDNKLRTMLKNSLILSLACLPMNFLLTAFVVAVAFLLCSVLSPLGVGIVMFVCLIAFLRFPIDFYVARTIKRKILPAQEETDTKYEYFANDDEIDDIQGTQTAAENTKESDN